MKTCKTCYQTLPLDQFYRGRKDCKPCHLLDKKAKYDPEVAADKHLRTKYGVSLEKYNLILASQNGACAICREYNVDRTLTHKRMPLDHCHTTGKVRGILCNRCNLVLGKLGDNIGLLQNAITYLSTHN